MSRRRIIYVPVITDQQLTRAAKLTARLVTLCGEIDDCHRNLDASLSVLARENMPEGWTPIRTIEEISKRAWKRSLKKKRR
jgi:hypothetical protein